MALVKYESCDCRAILKDKRGNGMTLKDAECLESVDSMTSPKAPRFDPYSWSIQDLYPMERTEELGGVVSCGRIWLVIFNTVFTIVGLASFVIGCVMRFQSDVFSSYLAGLMTTVQAGETNLSLSAYLDAIAFTLIVTGIFIFVIGAVGCLGSCCKLRTCLVMYAVIVLLVLTMQVIGTTLLFTMKSQLDASLKTVLKRTLKSSYTGDTGTDPVTIAWNFVFVQLDCCGVDNYTDVQSSVQWNRSVGYAEFNAILQTPFTCCKLEGDFPDFEWPSDPFCAIKPNYTTSNFNIGCYAALENFFETYSVAFIAVAVILAFIEIANAIAAILIFRDLNAKVDVVKE